MQINWEALGAIGEIAGAIVVVATLAYLARQIHQSNRIAVATTEIGVRNSLSSLNESAYTDTGLAEILMKSADPNSELTPVETFKTYIFILRCMNAWLSVETAYSNGLVPPQTYGVIEDDIRYFLASFPSTQPLWHQAVDNYPALAPTEVLKTVIRVLEEQKP